MTVDPLIHLEPSYSVQDVRDSLRIMRKQEATIYRRSAFLYTSMHPSSQGSGKSPSPRNGTSGSASVVDGSWRQRIVEWMYGVVDHCNLRRDSVAVAAYYLDLSLENGIIHSRREFQLCAMTALQLAIKLYDSTLVKLDSMVKLGRGLFTEKDVIAMEMKMLQALHWHVHPPTPVCFLRQYLRLLSPSTVSPFTRYLIAEVTRFISEISICLSKFVKYPPSVIAYAGMIIAMDRISADEIGSSSTTTGTLPTWQRREIFEILESAVDMDYSQTMVGEAVAELQLSLERNVSLQELMNTIDAQCQQQQQQQQEAYQSHRGGSSYGGSSSSSHGLSSHGSHSHSSHGHPSHGQHPGQHHPHHPHPHLHKDEAAHHTHQRMRMLSPRDVTARRLTCSYYSK